jgi:hypothetical protein
MRFRENVKIIIICLISSTISLKITLIEVSAIALDLGSQKNGELLANNSDIAKKTENQQLLKQKLKNAKSNLETTQNLSRKAGGRGQEAEGKLLSVSCRDQREQGFKTPTQSPTDLLLLPRADARGLANAALSCLLPPSTEFTIADVIPIEEYKVQPPQPDDRDEQETQPAKTQQYTPTQQILIQKLRRSKNQQQAKQKQIILDALTFSANKYPWIVNPTDNLTFQAELFKPSENENYIDTDLDIKFSGDEQIIDKFTYAKFPKADQFYWVLDQNRIVVETKGSQVGIILTSPRMSHHNKHFGDYKICLRYLQIFRI